MMYTVESVRKGHPDKIADKIADAILDATLLHKDPNAKVAIEVMLGGNGRVVIMGESSHILDTNVQIAKGVLEELNYNTDSIQVFDYVQQQSLELNKNDGAGDQGIVYGYATNETESYLPLGVHYANRLAKKLDTYITDAYDGKVQLSILNNRISDVVVSVEKYNKFKHNIIVDILHTFLPINNCTKLHINPIGAFEVGGLYADTGLTGRKISVDTYGGVVSHGGGAFSGKDGTKLDRSGAYMARYIAKDIVRHGFADKALVSLAYVIGGKYPIQITGVDRRYRHILQDYDLSPQGIINFLGLNKPIYKQTTNYGHFGWEEHPWE